MKSILEVKNLKVYNKNTEILSEISFDLKEGEILGIVGESGCGKSTLIRAIIQMMDDDEGITEGDILFDEKSLVNIPKEEMRKIRGNEIGIVFQNPGSTLNPTRKIGKQFVETMQSHMKISKKEALKKAMYILEKMNLTDRCILNSYPYELSGGMKQRVAIALAVCLEPKLLVADEPTSALDVMIQGQVVNEMIKLRNNINTSIVIVTHSMGVISKMADKVAVMYGGNVVEYGNKDEVLSKPMHPYTKALLKSIPKLNGELPEGIKGNPPTFTEKIAGCKFNSRCSKCGKKCKVIKPSLKNISDGRWVACNQINEMEQY